MLWLPLVRGRALVKLLHSLAYETVRQFYLVVVGRAFEEGSEFARARRVAQLAQSFGFDLADAFSSDGECLAYFFESVLASVVQAETHLDYFFLARRERLQHGRSLFFQAQVDYRVGRRDYGLVLDETTERRIFFFADGSFERDWLLRDFQNLPDLCDRNIHALGDFFRGGLAAELLHELALGADEFVDRLDHVDRDADGASLVGDGAGDGLANPPRGVRGELVAPTPFEFVHGFHQADIAFLN